MSAVQLEPELDLGGTRLCLRPELQCSLRETDGRPFYVLEDPIHSKFFHIGAREWVLASLLDGTKTLREAVQLADATLGDERLSPDEATRVCRWLTQSKLATVQQPVSADNSQWQPGRQRRGVLNPLFLRIPLCNPDRLLSHLLPWTRWMLTLPSVLVWMTVCTAAVLSVWSQGDRFSSSFSQILAPHNWLYLLLAWILLKIAHESFHGLVCKKYGGSVPRCGIMLILFSPVAYVDLTSSWRFASKWPRIYTAAAGMYVELFVGALAALIWASSDHGLSAQLCHNIVVMAGVSTLLFNANFLMRFDGYYILSDLLGVRNLYSAGQEYVRYVCRRYILDVPALPSEFSGTKLAIVRAYGVAALIWRLVFYLGVIVLASTLLHGAGIVLAVLSAVIWFGLPTLRFVKYLLIGSPGEHPDRRRFALVTAVATAAGWGLLSLPWPGGVSAPAVVEYAPLTVIRVESPGFVQEVRVRDGQLVAADDVLMVLQNPQLHQQLADLNLTIQQSQVKGRMLHHDNQLADSIVERENRATLVAKRDELQRQVEKLTVRAPRAGRVVARNLDALVGQYVEVGRQLATMGLEDHKELQMSIKQADVDAFRSRRDDAISVRIKGRAGRVAGAQLVRINPRATRSLVHPALAAHAGGPLAVTHRPSDPAAQTELDEPFELTAPRFTATAQLPAVEARRLRAGELAKARVRRIDETIGQRLWLLVKGFVDRKVGRPAA